MKYGLTDMLKVTGDLGSINKKLYNLKMKSGKKTIKSPEEVYRLMEDLWINHKAGNKVPQNNFLGGTSIFIRRRNYIQ